MKTNGRPVMIYTKFIFPLLLLLFSLKFCFAFEFLEDTVDVTQSNTKISIFNGSSQTLIVDSIKVILLEGTISSQIFFYAVDTPKTYPIITVKESLANNKDSLFNIEKYSGYGSDSKVKLLANKKSFIYHFEIGTCVGEKPTLYKKSNNLNSTVFDYVIKLNISC